MFHHHPHLRQDHHHCVEDPSQRTGRTVPSPVCSVDDPWQPCPRRVCVPRESGSARSHPASHRSFRTEAPAFPSSVEASAPDRRSCRHSWLASGGSDLDAFDSGNFASRTRSWISKGMNQLLSLRLHLHLLLLLLLSWMMDVRLPSSQQKHRRSILSSVILTQLEWWIHGSAVADDDSSAAGMCPPHPPLMMIVCCSVILGMIVSDCHRSQLLQQKHSSQPGDPESPAAAPREPG